MKTLNRNKTKFYYALYESKQPVKDEYGNPTSEYEIVHSDPKKYFANISAAKGETQTRQFGESEDYDKVIVMDNNLPRIDEYSVLWIDKLPQFDNDGKTTTPYDYEVKEVASSLNSVSIAVSKVNVS